MRRTVQRAIGLGLGGLIVAGSISAWALDEIRVIESIKKSHPVLRSAKQQVKAAQGSLRASEGEFDTKVKVNHIRVPEGKYQSRRLETGIEQPTKIWGTRLTAGYNSAEGVFPVYDGKLETAGGGESYVGLQVPLLRDGPTDDFRTRIKVRELQAQQANATLDTTRNQLVREGRKTYWDWVGHGYTLRIQRDLLKLAEDRDKALRIRVQRGDKPAIEQVDNERLIYQRRNQVVRAEQMFQVSSQQLALYYRDDRGEPVVLGLADLPLEISDPPESDVNTEGLIRDGLTRRPEFSELTAQIDQADAENRLADTQYLPQLNFSFEKVQQLGDQDVTTKSEDHLRFGLFFELPLQQRKASGRDRETLARKSSLEIRRQFLSQKITADVTQAALSISLLRQALTAARTELKLARQVERGEKVRFEKGQSDLVIVNLREQATADAAIREVDSLIRYHKALAELEAEIGLHAR